MYERFTDNARVVMQSANREAERLQHESVDTAHILLAIAKHGRGVANRVLTCCGVDISQIPELVLSLVEQGDCEPVGRLPQSNRTMKVVELAMEEAVNSHHRYVGTEHLLIGLLLTNGVAAEAPSQLRVDSGPARQKMLEVLDTPDYRNRNEAFARRADRTMYASLGLMSVIFLLGVITIGIIIRRFF